MLHHALRDHHIILASGSPRRQQYFEELGLEVAIRPIAIEEEYPPTLVGKEISEYLAKLKADAFGEALKERDILITSDTVVWHNGRSLAKPGDGKEAYGMLKSLSNDRHEVITSVCFTTSTAQKTLTATTKVRFRALTDAEIWFYVENYSPFDKAGGYGIQEWIGLIGIEEIRGSYPNVVGLPTHLVYKTLMDMVS